MAQVLGLEFLLGAMEENAEVAAIDAEFPADLIAVTFFEEDGLEQGAVARSNVEEDGADLVLDLMGDGEVEGAGGAGRQLGLSVGVEGDGSAGGAIVLLKDVGADGIDECAEAFGLAETSFLAEDGEDADECLLTDVFDGVLGLEAGAQFESEQVGEVGHKMLLSFTISGPKPADISCIERVELQCFLPPPKSRRV